MHKRRTECNEKEESDKQEFLKIKNIYIDISIERKTQWNYPESVTKTQNIEEKKTYRNKESTQGMQHVNNWYSKKRKTHQRDTNVTINSNNLVPCYCLTILTN